MKKTILLVVASFATIFASAQMTSKNGATILPEEGDWSIGIGATSTLNYVGNLLNGTSNNSSMAFDWNNPNKVITAKLMVDPHTAYRAGVRLGFGSKTDAVVASADGDVNETKASGFDLTLSAGIQKYRGKGRVQGIYGAEAFFNLSGNKVDTAYQGTPFAGSTLSYKRGTGFGLGVRGFVGVEYFIAPKMSLSGEFNWGLVLATTAEAESKIADGNGGSTTLKGGKSSAFGIDTDNAGGNINLNFYF